MTARRNGFIAGALASLLLTALFSFPGVRADAGRVGGGAIALALQLTGGTLTGGLTFSGVTTDITTGTDEALTLAPNGTGDVLLNPGDDLIVTAADEIVLNADSASAGVIIDNGSSRNRIRGAAGGGAIQLHVAPDGTKVGALTDYTAGQAVFCARDTMTTSSAGTDLMCVDGVGSITTPQTTSGTPPTIRVPTLVAASGGTAPACSAATDEGKMFYVDDTDDVATPGVLCLCRDDGAGTLELVSVPALTACPNPT